MRTITSCVLVVAMVLVTVCNADSNFEDPRRDMMMGNLPYGRGLDSDLQLARLLLMSQRICHTKRNSELINSLLGMPKNMNNAGK